MLSIIVCSTDDSLRNQLQKSIQDTVSCRYELLMHDNRQEPLSLAAAYNRMAEKATYPSLIFLHQDIIFHESGWDQKITRLLDDPSIGLVGTSGSIYKSQYPGSWSMTLEEFYRIDAYQRMPDHTIRYFCNLANGVSFEEVVVIDGFLMAVKKDVWNRIKFKESELRGFHYYDYDYSLDISTEYKVVVASGIHAEHLSMGTFNAEWIAASIQWHQKQKDNLPAMVQHIPPKMKKQADYRSCSGFAMTCLQNNQKISVTLKYMFLSFMISPFDRFNRSLLHLFFNRIFRTVI